MILHNNPSFSIYFGDTCDNLLHADGLFDDTQFLKIQKNLQLKNLVFLQQTHGVMGRCIDESALLEKPLDMFRDRGDMLLSNRKAVGVGVLTADCLPIVLYDALCHCIAIVHAGWRGTLKNIVAKTVESMQNQFGCVPQHLQVFFGPSAKVCCYEVQKDFLQGLEESVFADQVIINRGRLFFDLSLLNKLQLLDVGVLPERINDRYNICTICKKFFHSYRRDGKFAGRQATIAVLK